MIRLVGRIAMVMLGVLLLQIPLLADAADTGFQSPTATGDDYTDWSTPDDAFVSNEMPDLYAVETRNGQMQDWYNFSLFPTSGSTIDGIEVRVEAQDNFCNDAEGAFVELSWDGGTSYTSTGNNFKGGCVTDTITTLGGATDTWGRTWTSDDFSNTNFRIRLSKKGFDFDPAWVDHIQVKVYYTSPTAVDLIAFTAISNEGGVLLQWRTGYEVDNLGFHLYREMDDHRIRVTSSLIAGSALLAGPNTHLTAGRSYTWWDPEGTRTARYWLEEVDLHGQHTWHGPVLPVAGGGVPSDRVSSPLLHQLGRSRHQRDSAAATRVIIRRQGRPTPRRYR